MNPVWRYRMAIVALCACTTAHRGEAQGATSLDVTADIEGWSTDSSSAMLARNHGRPAALGRLRIYSAVEPVKGLVAYVQGELAAGSANDQSFKHELEQAGLRYTRSRALVLDAGIISPIVGAYASRRASTRNPLIGDPDGYSAAYPAGVRVSGKMPYGDYRVGVVSLPVYNDRWMPDPTSAAHVAAGAGLTPAAGVRIGASGSIGPWLRDDFDAATLRDRSWRSYEQRVLAVDAELSRGYVDFHGELAHAWHDVPGRATMMHGASWYGDVAYAMSPRVFTAIRVENNDYPYLRPFGSLWSGNEVHVSNAEVGVGYRFSAAETLKMSYRRDHWSAAPTARVLLPDGHAIAVQLTTALDVLGAIDRLRTR